MTTSAIDTRLARALRMVIADDSLTVELADGRSLSVPLAWYPRLVHAKVRERRNCKLTGKGTGLHWPDLDEDISVENLLLGQPSGESQRSLQAWLDARAPRKQAKPRAAADKQARPQMRRA